MARDIIRMSLNKPETQTILANYNYLIYLRNK